MCCDSSSKLLVYQYLRSLSGLPDLESGLRVFCLKLSVEFSESMHIPNSCPFLRHVTANQMVRAPALLPLHPQFSPSDSLLHLFQRANSLRQPPQSTISRSKLLPLWECAGTLNLTIKTIPASWIPLLIQYKIIEEIHSFYSKVLHADSDTFTRRNEPREGETSVWMGSHGTLEARGLYPRVRQTQAITWGAQMFHKNWFNNVFCHLKQLLLFSISFTFLNNIKWIRHVHHDSSPVPLIQWTTPAYCPCADRKQGCWYGNKPVGAVIVENEGESPLNSAAKPKQARFKLKLQDRLSSEVRKVVFLVKTSRYARSIRPVRKHTTFEQ